MIFKQLNYLQNMAFKMINNLRLFMTGQHVCSNSTNLLFKSMICIEEPPYGVCFHCVKTSHLVKKILLWLQMICCMNQASGIQMKKISVVNIPARQGFTNDTSPDKLLFFKSGHPCIFHTPLFSQLAITALNPMSNPRVKGQRARPLS